MAGLPPVSCIARYDYVAEHNDELTLRVGDVITQVTNKSHGWWSGTLGEDTGFFPENFVTVHSVVDYDESPNSLGSPVQLRPKGSVTNAYDSPLNRTPSFKMSSNLFEPEDEEAIGPMFGVLSLQSSHDTLSQSNQESDISSVISVISHKSQKGFLGRIRHSVGSRLPNILSSSRLSGGSKVGGIFDSRHSIGSKIGGSLRETGSACTPKMGKRRKSITTFFKRTSSNSSNSKLNKNFGENEETPSRLSKSRDFVRRSLTLRPFSQEADEEIVDFGCGLSSACQSLEVKNPQASLSWIWQEMGEKGTDTDTGLEISSWDRLNSGFCTALGHKLDRRSQDSEDSGIDKTLSRNYTNPHAIFGSVPELCDNIFNDIFKTQITVPSANFSPGEKESENIQTGIISDDYDKDAEKEVLKKKILRNPIRTNPHVKWNPSMISKTNRDTINQEMNENENKVIKDFDNICREDKVVGVAERKVLRRNPIRTNPHNKWNPPKSVRDKEKVTSI